MKRILIFLTVFAFVIIGLIVGTRDAQTTQRADDISIIKIHLPHPDCEPGGWYGKVRLHDYPNGTQWQCGPTTCACGPSVPAGYWYDVWGEGPNCKVTETQLVFHEGLFTDVYLQDINYSCR